MEWCLDCHRNPAKNLRPTAEIYNMDWQKPSDDRPVWCAATQVTSGTPTAEGVSCTVREPEGGSEAAASLMPEALLRPAALTGGASAPAPPPIQYEKFTSQEQLGHFLLAHYKIRTPKDLTSCEVCHR
jgi:hypothetical protein